MSNQRLLAMGFIVLAGSAAYVLERIADLALGLMGVMNGDVFGGIHLSALVGIGLAAAVATFSWANPKVQEAGQGVAAELRKVTWPTWPELRAATMAVVIFALVAATVLGMMDFVSAKVMSDWIPAGFRSVLGVLA